MAGGLVISMEATLRALERLGAQAEAAGLAAATAAAHVGETEIKRQLSRYSHPKGTPTPSPPGEPPAIVSGSLRRSIIVKPHKDSRPAYVEVGPTMVYARAQELGYRRLPPRPYVEPARAIVMAGPAQTAALAAFAKTFYR